MTAANTKNALKAAEDRWEKLKAWLEAKRMDALTARELSMVMLTQDQIAKLEREQ